MFSGKARRVGAGDAQECLQVYEPQMFEAQELLAGAQGLVQIQLAVGRARIREA